MKRAAMPDFAGVRGQHLLVALSGGADSVALLCLLAERRSALSLTLSAAHVEHGIRGEESRADAAYCRGLCGRLDIPFHLAEIDVPAGRLPGEGLETAARRLRYDALRRIRRETGADFIALAHHRDDQAETVLMHLLRGCGPDGVSAMEEFSEDLYRPLLNTPKRALEIYLSLRGVDWRTDATNSDDFTPRNSIRLHGLPALEKSYPQAAQAICRYAEAAQCENRFMARMTQAFCESHVQRGPYGTRILKPCEADEAILRRAVRRLTGGSLPQAKLLEITALAGAKRGRLDVNGALFAERTPDALYFLPKNATLPPALDLGCETVWPGVGRMTAFTGEAAPVRGDPFHQALRADVLEGAVLRTRADGDRFRPLGCGDRLLSDYLTDRKIDRPLRDYVPLVARGSRVLWVVGHAIAQEAALTGSEASALHLRWIEG